MKKAILKERVIIDSKQISPKLYRKIVADFTHEHKKFLVQEDCRNCSMEHDGDPPCTLNEGCERSTIFLPMYNITKKKSKTFLELWRGDMPKVLKTLKGFKLKDKRSTNAANKKLKFIGKLKKHQLLAVLNWCRAKHGGMIVAPARSGKTVIGAYVTVQLGLKTLVLAHQIDLLDQFYDTFLKFTNASKFRRSIVIAEKGNIVKCVEQGYDIILSTYQTFISKACKERLN